MTGVTARAGVRRLDQWCARCCRDLGGSSGRTGAARAPLRQGRWRCSFLIVGAWPPHRRKLRPRRGYRQGVRRRQGQLPSPGRRARDRIHERPPCLLNGSGSRPYWPPAYSQKIWSTAKWLNKCFYPSGMAWLRHDCGALSSPAGGPRSLADDEDCRCHAAKKKCSTGLVAMQSVVAICALWTVPSRS